MSPLPQNILDMVEMNPIEDLILQLIRPKLAGISVQATVQSPQPETAVVVRRASDWGAWNGDARFVDAGTLEVHVYTVGLNADQDGALLSEAVRVALLDSLNEVVPSLGHLQRVRLQSAPRRVADWATASGPVQYADLPQGSIRYESTYQLRVRRALS